MNVELSLSEYLRVGYTSWSDGAIQSLAFRLYYYQFIILFLDEFAENKSISVPHSDMEVHSLILGRCFARDLFVLF